MKWVLVLVFCGSCLVGFGQEQEIEQLLLDVEKLAQFKQILSEMEQGYEVLTNGYNAIKDLSEGNFSLHQAFLDGLLAVSPAVQKYYKVAKIAALQKELLQEFERGRRVAKNGQHFSNDERDYQLQQVNRLLELSVQNISSLIHVLTAGELRMNDAQRLSAIDALYEQFCEQLIYIKQFGSSWRLLGLQRAKEMQDVTELRILFGLSAP